MKSIHNAHLLLKAETAVSNCDFSFFTAVICKQKAVKSIQVIICVNVPVSIIQSASFTVEYSDSHGVHSAKGEL